MTVELLTRKGCCLCERARDALLRVRADLPFELTEIDIDAPEPPAPAYRAQHGLEIPVVRVRGEVIARLRLDEAALRAALTSEPRA